VQRISWRQRQSLELELAKPIKIWEPKPFNGNLGDVCDIYLILIQVYVQDKKEKFPMYERTINWIGYLLGRYAVAWHIQRLNESRNGIHHRSLTGYVNAVNHMFENW
jgi:hypothetical protein